MEDSVDDIWSDTTGEKYLYRYRPANVFSIDEIMNSYIYFSSHASLNDLNECRPFLYESEQDPSENRKLELIMEGAKSRERLAEIQRTYLDSFMLDHNDAWLFVNESYKNIVGKAREVVEKLLADKQWGICCFSKKALNQTMMAHYGNNEGFIVCYDASAVTEIIGIDSSPVTYKETPGGIDLLSVAFSPHSDETAIAISIITSQKSTDWIYEREVRLVSETFVNENVYFDRTPIRGICVGPRASDATKRVSCRLANSMSVPIYEAVVGDGYNFRAEPLELSGFEEE